MFYANIKELDYENSRQKVMSVLIRGSKIIINK